MGPAVWDSGSKRITLVFCFLFSLLLGARPLPTATLLSAEWKAWGPMPVLMPSGKCP